MSGEKNGEKTGRLRQLFAQCFFLCWYYCSCVWVKKDEMGGHTARRGNKKCL